MLIRFDLDEFMSNKFAAQGCLIIMGFTDTDIRE